MIRYLLISVLIVAASCRSSVQSTASNKNCVSALVHLDSIRGWYATKIDVYQRHFSGLLLIKSMTDGSIRLVFTNEAGVTFFDFEFDSKGQFHVKKIIKQLDRSAVITTLKKDLALLLGIPFRDKTPFVSFRNEQLYHAVRQKKDEAYFITDGECASLQSLGIAGDSKEKVIITSKGDVSWLDKIVIEHRLFDMAIALTKIQSH